MALKSEYCKILDDESWSVALQPHFLGHFSACTKSKSHFQEDHAQVETSKNATFIGIYNGHQGNTASMYLKESLFRNILGRFRKYIKKCYMNTTAAKYMMEQTCLEIDENFLHEVERGYMAKRKENLSVVSSGCLIGMIWGGKLYLANVGESRAIVCSKDGGPNLLVQQILKGCGKKNGCIGNAYLKQVSFTREPSFKLPPGEQVNTTSAESVPSAIPETHIRTLEKKDKFIIFGSGGFWKLVTDDEACKMVNNHPRQEVARLLVSHAVQNAAEKVGLAYKEVLHTPIATDSHRSCQTRLNYIDDITVIVLFLDWNMHRAESKSYSYKSYESVQ